MTDNIQIIKKYKNRRLYDTYNSKYINLEDLYDLIKQGVEFKVLEAGSEKDITRSTLIQVIFEFENREYNLLPTEFLKFIVRMQGHPMNELFLKYLSQLMEQFRGQTEQLNQFYGPDYSNLMKKYYENMESGLDMYKEFYENLTSMNNFTSSPDSSKDKSSQPEEDDKKEDYNSNKSQSDKNKDQN